MILIPLKSELGREILGPEERKSFDFDLLDCVNRRQHPQIGKLIIVRFLHFFHALHRTIKIPTKPQVADRLNTLWARSTKNPDVSTGPRARPFARSLTPSLVG